MARLTLHAQGLDAALVAELEPGVALLVGRAPDPARAAESLPRGVAVRTLTVASPHVSSNHCAVLLGPDGPRVLDLESKNGTWARLSPGNPIVVGGAELALFLAAVDAVARKDERLPAGPLVWSDPSGFAPAVVRAVNGWLSRLGMPAAASVGAKGARAAFRLADGSELSVAQSGETVDLRWPERLVELASFVEEQNGLFEQEAGHDEGFVLCAPRFREAHARVFEAAQRGRRVLLLGPSGAGKERLAECYHRHSRRAEGPFKPLHCGLLEKDMLWVQLFGAARGSYTGAVRDMVGAVEAAHGGTLFLDEVGELSPRVQSALLRLLDRHGEYERLGDPRVRHAELQVVCATNLDLRAAVARGDFREDLWYRFTGTVVQVPPLRERREDLVAWLRARLVAPRLSALEALSPEALELLYAHRWPGNFRELDNFVSRLPTVTRAGALSARVCREALAEGTTGALPSGASPEAPAPAQGWSALVLQATAAYEEDHAGAGPRTLGELRALFEDYLRPLFVAQGCGLEGQPSLPEGLNYSSLGRRLDIADGTTVKKNLQRYFERYRRNA